MNDYSKVLTEMIEQLRWSKTKRTKVDREVYNALISRAILGLLDAQEKALTYKHTDECLRYAASTGKAFCIAECRDGGLVK